MPAGLTHDDFAAAVGDTFQIDFGEAGNVDLELIEATSGGTNAGPRDPFSLRFRGPTEPLLGQATYRLSHASLGTLDIFIVPIAADSGGIDYEAVFA